VSISDDPAIESISDLNRLIYFSDGVFAIAVTLSAFQIRVPVGEEDLARKILDLLPEIGVYAFSFFVIAAMWRTHHRMFQFIKRGDGRLITLNLAGLLVIAFMPFPVALVGNYGDQRAAVVTYAVAMTFAAGALAAIWLHATHGRRRRP
jgi:uncharacterized membrane protein